MRISEYEYESIIVLRLILTTAFPDNASILILINGTQYSNLLHTNHWFSQRQCFQYLWCESTKAVFSALVNLALLCLKCRTSAWLPSLRIDFNNSIIVR